MPRGALACLATLIRTLRSARACAPAAAFGGLPTTVAGLAAS